jgi:hypothetical protein
MSGMKSTLSLPTRSVRAEPSVKRKNESRRRNCRKRRNSYCHVKSETNSKKTNGSTMDLGSKFNKDEFTGRREDGVRIYGIFTIHPTVPLIVTVVMSKIRCIATF